MTGEPPTADRTGPTGTSPRVRVRYDHGLAVYHRAGLEADAATVVFVHGAMDRAASFIRAVRRRPNLEVIRYDRRGYGRSTDIGVCASMDESVDDLLTVAGGRPAVLIGHSLGGAIALAAAARAPHLVRAVGTFEAPLWARDESPAAGPARSAKPDLADSAGAGERFMRRMIGDDAWSALPESTRATRRAEGPALVADLAAMAVAGARIRTTPVAVPLVVGYGTTTSDRHRSSAQLLARATEGSELVTILGAGHDAHRTHPDDFARFVDRTVERAVERAIRARLAP